jgi:glucokinase
MILAGDTGGTKTLLSLYEPEPGSGLRAVHQTIYACADFPSLEAVVDKFLADAPPAARSQPVGAACFGVAGPVVDGRAKITNLPWTIDARSLAQRLGGVPVSLLNDLQATALGTLQLPDEAFAILQPGLAGGEAGDRAAATIGVIAPGTGIGMSILVSIDGRYHALPTEGGHVDFAANTDEEVELWRYLRGLYGAHVSVERVLRGDGIGDLYDFLRARPGATAEPEWLTTRLASADFGDRNAAISAIGLEGKDATCARVLEMFAEILGAEAGNLALRCLATGGITIGGGIPPKILPALQTGRLVDRFRAKGRFAGWLSTLPVRVALEPRAALIGAAHRAAAELAAR